MILKTTDIGIQKSIEYSNNQGPQPNIVKFLVGTTDIADIVLLPPTNPSNQTNGTATTEIFGPVEVDHDSPSYPYFSIISYRVISVDTMEYVLRLEQTVGNWNITNLGVYTQDPNDPTNIDLFAIGVFDVPIYKQRAGEGTSGNIVEFLVRVSFGGASVVINWEVNPVTSAYLLELSSVDNLLTPTLADSNVYLISGDVDASPYGLTDNGDAFLAVKKDTKYWSFSEYSKIVASGIVEDSTSTSITCSTLPVLFFEKGRYLIQFTSGEHEGIVRSVSDVPLADTIDWITSTGDVVAVGTTFEIICSDYYAMGSSKITEIDSVDNLPLPNDTDSTMYNVNGILSNPFGKDDGGNGFLVFLNDSDKSTWAFSNYKLKTLDNITIDSGDDTTVNSTAIGTALGDFSTGRFIARFESGDNAGLVRVITSQGSDTFSWYTALPYAVENGDRVTVFQSDVYSFGTGGGTGGPGDFRVETIVSTGTDTFNLTLVNANYAIPFLGTGFQDPTQYTVNSSSEITFQYVVPAGIKVHFLEVAKGLAVNGLPVGGAIGQVPIKSGVGDFEVAWGDAASGTHGTVALVWDRINPNTIKLVPYKGKHILIGGSLKSLDPSNLPNLNISGLSNNSVYWVWAYWDGTFIKLSVDLVLTSSCSLDSNGVIIKYSDSSKTLVGVIAKNKYSPLVDTTTNPWISPHYLRSFYNDSGTLPYSLTPILNIPNWINNTFWEINEPLNTIYKLEDSPAVNISTGPLYRDFVFYGFLWPYEKVCIKANINGRCRYTNSTVIKILDNTTLSNSSILHRIDMSGDLASGSQRNVLVSNYMDGIYVHRNSTPGLFLFYGLTNFEYGIQGANATLISGSHYEASKGYSSMSIDYNLDTRFNQLYRGTL